MKLIFSSVEIGQVFFDPYSGEQFVKISDTEGECLLSGESDKFDSKELVEI